MFLLDETIDSTILGRKWYKIHLQTEFFYNSDQTAYYTYFIRNPSDWSNETITEWIVIPREIDIEDKPINILLEEVNNE